MASLEISLEKMAKRGKIVEDLIKLERPELLHLFFTYQNEATAARKLLDSSLIDITSGVEILEVGGGILALTIQLASEGFKVTTVEPVGVGFAGIAFIMKIYKEVAEKEKVEFNLIEYPIEDCKFDQKFDFIFSINVMEHLTDPYSSLLKISRLLARGGIYRFICPNYDFPYEPHFAKWIFLRQNKAFYLRQKRAELLLVSQQEAFGLYQSLNFITFSRIKKFSDDNKIVIRSNRDAFYDLLQRARQDVLLGERHSGLTSIMKIVYLLKLHYFAKLVPLRFQPVMDVEATRSKVY